MNFDLLIVASQKILSTPARDRSHALEIFVKRLDVKLTVEGRDATGGPPYLLDEWEASPEAHWVNPTIRVFEEPPSVSVP